MANNLLQEITRLLKNYSLAGRKYAWLSPENRAFLERSPRPARPQQQPLTPPGAPATRVAPQQTPLPAQMQTPKNQTRPSVAVPPSQPVTSWGRQPQETMPDSVSRSEGELAEIKQADWDSLVGICRNCASCKLCKTRKNVVIEDGCRQARVMFIGEGPGQDEDEQGVPFVGRAGQLLTKMIAAMGLSRTSSDPDKSVYIANIVKCRPPQNRNPQSDEESLCLPLLKRQIELVNPKVIILLGAVPLKALLGRTGITRLRGQWLDYQGIPVMPTFHPSYLLHCENQPTLLLQEKRNSWHDLQSVMKLLGLPLPQPQPKPAAPPPPATPTPSNYQ